MADLDTIVERNRVATEEKVNAYDRATQLLNEYGKLPIDKRDPRRLAMALRALMPPLSSSKPRRAA
jgi:hypothetical protein